MSFIDFSFKRKKRRTRNPISKNVRRDILERDGWRCKWCKRSVRPKNVPILFWNINLNKNKANIDHKKPFARGGSDDFNNLQTYCEHCNKSKGSRRKPAYQRTLIRVPWWVWVLGGVFIILLLS